MGNICADVYKIRSLPCARGVCTDDNAKNTADRGRQQRMIA